MDKIEDLIVRVFRTQNTVDGAFRQTVRMFHAWLDARYDLKIELIENGFSRPHIRKIEDEVYYSIYRNETRFLPYWKQAERIMRLFF